MLDYFNIYKIFNKIYTFFLIGFIATPKSWAGGHGEKPAAGGHGEEKVIPHGGADIQFGPPKPHKWGKYPWDVPFPAFSVAHLFDKSRTVAFPLEKKSDRVAVVFFLASWCELCKKILPQVVKLEDKYKTMPVDFYYLFSHDTLLDEQTMAKAHGLRSLVGEAPNDVMEQFKNPNLPTIYLSDRYGNLLHRYVKNIGPKELGNLDEILDHLVTM